MIKLQSLANLPPIDTQPSRHFFIIIAWPITPSEVPWFTRSYVCTLELGTLSHVQTTNIPWEPTLPSPQPILLPLSPYPSPQFWWKPCDPPEVILAHRTSGRLFIHGMPPPTFSMLSLVILNCPSPPSLCNHVQIFKSCGGTQLDHQTRMLPEL